MSKDPNFPAMKWHPTTGESKLCTVAEDVPDGWLDTHPNNLPKPDEKAKPAGEPELPMTRKDIIKELDAAGVAFPKMAKTQALYDLLGDTAKNFLAAAKVDYAPDADVPSLLALVKANAPA